MRSTEHIPPIQPSEPQRPFVDRLVRWLAILGLCYGGVSIVSAMNLFAVDLANYSLWLAQYSQWPCPETIGEQLVIIQLIGMLSTPLLGILLVAASSGLLRWKPWSRYGMIAWAWLVLTTSLVLSLAPFLVYMRSLVATTQPTPSATAVPWSSVASWVEGTALPIVVLVVLLQREVAERFTPPRAGGFEVIPLANRAGEEPGSASANH